jgi:hypothetical protein
MMARIAASGCIVIMVLSAERKITVTDVGMFGTNLSRPRQGLALNSVKTSTRLRFLTLRNAHSFHLTMDEFAVGKRDFPALPNLDASRVEV